MYVARSKLELTIQIVPPTGMPSPFCMTATQNPTLLNKLATVSFTENMQGILLVRDDNFSANQKLRHKSDRLITREAPDKTDMADEKGLGNAITRVELGLVKRKLKEVQCRCVKRQA